MQKTRLSIVAVAVVSMLPLTGCALLEKDEPASRGAQAEPTTRAARAPSTRPQRAERPRRERPQRPPQITTAVTLEEARGSVGQSVEDFIAAVGEPVVRREPGRRELRNMDPRQPYDEILEYNLTLVEGQRDRAKQADFMVNEGVIVSHSTPYVSDADFIAFTDRINAARAEGDVSSGDVMQMALEMFGEPFPITPQQGGGRTRIVHEGGYYGPYDWAAGGRTVVIEQDTGPRAPAGAESYAYILYFENGARDLRNGVKIILSGPDTYDVRRDGRSGLK
jgi:hypothetical protein